MSGRFAPALSPDHVGTVVRCSEKQKKTRDGYLYPEVDFSFSSYPYD